MHRYADLWIIPVTPVDCSIYIFFSILLLRKIVLISLYLINYLLAVIYVISVRAFIENIIDIYIWSKLMLFRWRKFLAIYLFLNIIWNLNSGSSNSFSLVIFILKIYLFLIIFFLFNKLTRIYVLFSIIELYFRCIVFSYLLILGNYSVFWSVQGSRYLRLMNSLLISDSFILINVNRFG
jgi:hypothetical protein